MYATYRYICFAVTISSIFETYIYSEILKNPIPESAMLIIFKTALIMKKALKILSKEIFLTLIFVNFSSLTLYAQISAGVWSSGINPVRAYYTRNNVYQSLYPKHNGTNH